MTLSCGPLIITGMAANPPSLSEIAALVGSPARANMLTAVLISDNGERGFGETFGIDRVA